MQVLLATVLLAAFRAEPRPLPATLGQHLRLARFRELALALTRAARDDHVRKVAGRALREVKIGCFAAPLELGVNEPSPGKLLEMALRARGDEPNGHAKTALRVRAAVHVAPPLLLEVLRAHQRPALLAHEP